MLIHPSAPQCAAALFCARAGLHPILLRPDPGRQDHGSPLDHSLEAAVLKRWQRRSALNSLQSIWVQCLGVKMQKVFRTGSLPKFSAVSRGQHEILDAGVERVEDMWLRVGWCRRYFVEQVLYLGVLSSTLCLHIVVGQASKPRAKRHNRGLERELRLTS
ncbi:2OG-Fe(II)oxygenase [Diaporthe eres]|nr:2OG-Fe(II)oxygenase [Diaporthe eres]